MGARYIISNSLTFPKYRVCFPSSFINKTRLLFYEFSADEEAQKKLAESQAQAEKILQEETFEDMRPSNQQFFKVMKPHCDSNPEIYGTTGAPDIRNKMWSEKGKVPRDEDLEGGLVKGLLITSDREE